MKKIFSLFAAISMFSVAVFAQTDKPDAKTAQTILDAVSARYKAYKSVKAEFTIKAESSANQVTDQQSGTLYVKGDKFKLELTNQTIICDNKTIWTYLKDANEVQVNNYQPDENSISPAQIFTIYEKDFIYGFIEEKTVNGKVYQVIDLTPNDKTKPYFKIRLMIDKADKSVFSAKVFDKNGTHMTYEIQKLTPNPVLGDTFFTFDKTKYPGVDVEDLK